MSRRKKDPLRTLTDQERAWLERLSRSQHEPASHVTRAKQRLHVANGYAYQDAACCAGRTSGDAVSNVVKRFNREGLHAIQPRHGGGPVAQYGLAERTRIVQEVRRPPVPETDGPATWSLKTLCQALRKAPNGLPAVSEETIRSVLLDAGLRWQKARSWCETGTGLRQRKRGPVTVTDPDTMAEKI